MSHINRLLTTASSSQLIATMLDGDTCEEENYHAENFLTEVLSQNSLL